MIEPEIQIIEKIAAKNQKCMGCYKLLYGGSVYIVRIHFAAVAGGWSLCEDCIRKIFKEEIIQKAIEKMEK